MASGGQCRRRRLAEVSLVRCAPAKRLMRTPQIIPVEELGKTALLFDAVGRWAQVDPFVLHGPPQALDEDVVVAASASIHGLGEGPGREPGRAGARALLHATAAGDEL